MWDLLSFLIWTLVIVSVLFAIGFGTKLYLSGRLPFGTLLTPGRERRLDVVEQSNIDGKRKLLLVRRDDVEHLIMTGGPVDVVIETGIGSQSHSHAVARAATVSERASEPARDTINEPVFSRPARSFGKAVGEN